MTSFANSLFDLGSDLALSPSSGQAPGVSSPRTAVAVLGMLALGASPAHPSKAKPKAKAAPAAAPVAAGDRTRRKVRQGRVVSSKMEQTVVVAIESIIRHPLYGKTLRRTTKFKAHDPNNDCGVGDTVEIMETRPISREKRWRVSRIVERAK